VKTSTRPRLFYDQDCGFCRWSLLKILRWSGDGIDPVPIQSATGAEALGDLDPKARMTSWHLVLANGSRFSAGAAVPELMRYLPGLRPIAPLARRFVGPIDVLYRAVSRHRHRLSRLVGEQSCQLPVAGASPPSTEAPPKP
jgi:predicted DCC family thiol-disulfide oxidoreductase YuxK